MNLDLMATNADNEKESILPINYEGGKTAILLPQHGLFHTGMASPKVYYNKVLLKYNTDYRYVYRSDEIRRKYGIAAHAGIMLFSSSYSGQVTIVANHIGEEYARFSTRHLDEMSSYDRLLAMYDITTLTEIPEELPPRASLLDIENVTTGMLNSTQVIHGIATYLKNREDAEDQPASGYLWPDVTID